MPIVVQKYGGSSVADVERIGKVADKVAATQAAGKQVVVVVSAMGDTTDELLALAQRVSASPARRELDMLLSAGERISMALLSIALNERGVPAVSFTGSQSGIITNEAHSAARIVEVRPYRVQDELARGMVVIVAGYQGVSYRKEITTLGRGGSDTTAVALAAALEADCEIYSDVDGVYSADPRAVPGARRLAELSYEEMQELAEAGARVLNAQAVEFAKQKDIAIYARATAGGGETVIRKHAPRTPGRVVGVASQTGLVRLSAPGGLPAFTRVIEALRRVEVTGQQVTCEAPPGGGTALLLSLENVHDFGRVRAALAEAGGVTVEEDVGAVSAIGTGINASADNLLLTLRCLAALDAPILAVHTSSFRISVLLPAAHVPAAVTRLHDALVG